MVIYRDLGHVLATVCPGLPFDTPATPYDWEIFDALCPPGSGPEDNVHGAMEALLQQLVSSFELYIDSEKDRWLVLATERVPWCRDLTAAQIGTLVEALLRGWDFGAPVVSTWTVMLIAKLRELMGLNDLLYWDRWGAAERAVGEVVREGNRSGIPTSPLAYTQPADVYEKYDLDYHSDEAPSPQKRAPPPKAEEVVLGSEDNTTTITREYADWIRQMTGADLTEDATKEAEE